MQIYYVGGCLAGHDDDDYSYANSEWIKEFEIKKNIKKSKDKNNTK